VIVDTLNSKEYSVIYADPPWEYNNKRTGGSMKSGASQQYETMNTDDIIAILQSVKTNGNSVIFMWATTPLLDIAFRVLTDRFEYKTALTWRKIMSLGLGYWYRGQTEHLLVGIEGHIKPFRMQVPNFYESKVGKHSQKPQYFRRLIEESTKNIPDRRMIELFARGCHEGWDCWGNQASLELLDELVLNDIESEE